MYFKHSQDGNFRREPPIDRRPYERRQQFDKPQSPTRRRSRSRDDRRSTSPQRDYYNRDARPRPYEAQRRYDSGYRGPDRSRPRIDHDTEDRFSARGGPKDFRGGRRFDYAPTQNNISVNINIGGSRGEHSDRPYTSGDPDQIRMGGSRNQVRESWQHGGSSSSQRGPERPRPDPSRYQGGGRGGYSGQKRGGDYRGGVKYGGNAREER